MLDLSNEKGLAVEVLPEGARMKIVCLLLSAPIFAQRSCKPSSLTLPLGISLADVCVAEPSTNLVETLELTHGAEELGVAASRERGRSLFSRGDMVDYETLTAIEPVCISAEEEARGLDREEAYHLGIALSEATRGRVVGSEN